MAQTFPQRIVRYEIECAILNLLIKHKSLTITYYIDMSKKTCKPETPLNDYLLSILPSETEAQRLLREKTQREHPYKEMQVTPDQGAFLQWLIKTLGVKNIIEVGVFTGYSTLTMAQALPSDGTIIACDISQEWVQWGIPYWKMANCHHKIDLRIARAMETLQQLVVTHARTQDLIFVDADKPNYEHYYELCLQLLKPNGILILDNIFLMGRVITDGPEKKTANTIRALNQKIQQDPRVDITVLPVGDGMTLIRKQENT